MTSSTAFLHDRIWAKLKAASRKNPGFAHVAVAYFGQGATRMLPLRSGSRLVVDASEHAVKCGQTCPAELKKLVNEGVLVYSIANLHAKVFVFGRRAFIGSANVSRHSADTLIEGMIVTGDRKVVSDARVFVRRLCRQELGLEALDRLAKMYRPPKLPLPHGRRKIGKDRRIVSSLGRVMLAQVNRDEPPDGSESIEAAGLAVARKKMEHPRRHRVDHFWWLGDCPYKVDDRVVQVVDEGAGRKMVMPPGNVLNLRSGSRGNRRYTFVYLEQPKRRSMALARLAGRVGSGARKRLSRNGRVSREFADRLLEAWNT